MCVCVCVYISSYIYFSSYLFINYWEINFKEAIIGANKSAICRAAWLARNSVKGVDIAVLSLKSSGQVSRLKIQAWFPCYSLEAVLPLHWETLIFTFKVFNGLNEAHLH